MSLDPFEGAKTHEFTRGDHLIHPRIGECEFYKHDLMRQRLEVFDAYGMIRYIPQREVEKCRPLNNSDT